MLAWLLTALARLKVDDYRRMRHMYIRLPRAGREPGRNPADLELAKVHHCTGCRLCPQTHRYGRVVLQPRVAASPGSLIGQPAGGTQASVSKVDRAGEPAIPTGVT